MIIVTSRSAKRRHTVMWMGFVYVLFYKLGHGLGGWLGDEVTTAGSFGGVLTAAFEWPTKARQLMPTISRSRHIVLFVFGLFLGACVVELVVTVGGVLLGVYTEGSVNSIMEVAGGIIAWRLLLRREKRARGIPVPR
jgi:hypothetical protein